MMHLLSMADYVLDAILIVCAVAAAILGCL